MPKISVIIPVYNVENFLVKCLDSVMIQSFRDFEAIIVDDGSTDNSSAIAREYAAKYDNVHLITQENKGLGAARNTGIEAAKGEYFLFADSDDYIEKNALQLLYEKAVQTNADLIIFDIFNEDINGNIMKIDKGCTLNGASMTLKDFPELLIQWPCAWNKLYHRDLFLASGLRFSSRVWYEDLRLFPKILCAAECIENLDMPLYHYLQRPGSIMRSANIERNREIIDALDDVITYYKQQNFFKTYENELQYLAVYHVLITASVRVLKADRKHSLLKEFKTYVEINFPNYKQNPYLNCLNKREKMIFKFLSSGNSFALSVLLKLKDRIS